MAGDYAKELIMHGYDWFREFRRLQRKQFPEIPCGA